MAAMKAQALLQTFLVSAVSAAAASAFAPVAERIAPIDASDFDRLLAEIKPTRGESPWREIPWLVDLTAARRRSIAEDKPILIFTAADGSPLART
jgi:hypothetical protein